MFPPTEARVSALPSDKQGLFWSQYNANRKNATTGVILALFLGGIGIHEFYLGNTGGGVVMLLFCWTFIPAFIALIQCFTMGGRVSQMNDQLANKILSNLQANQTATPLERIGNADTINSELEKINAMLKAGSISQEEHAALRKKALGL